MTIGISIYLEKIVDIGTKFDIGTHAKRKAGRGKLAEPFNTHRDIGNDYRSFVAETE